VDFAQIMNVAASSLVALCSLVFVIVYHTHAPWRSTPVGRHLMAFTATIGALGAYTVAATMWPDGLAAMVLRFVRTAILLLIAGLVAQRIRMVLAAQHQDRSEVPPSRSGGPGR
jgi:FlaA1/EpsC-like NDP-sugar epimerase